MEIRNRFLPDKFTPSSVISLVFHPLLTPAPAGVLILWLDGLQLESAVRWISLCALVVVFPLGLYIAIMKVRWGQETSIRENRHQLYVIGIGLTILLVIILELFQGPKLLKASIYSGAVSGIIGSLTNVLNKVSLHVGVSTGISIVLFNVSPAIGVSGGILTVLIGLARYRMGHHTTKQILIAILIPSVGILSVFVAMRIPIFDVSQTG